MLNFVTYKQSPNKSDPTSTSLNSSSSSLTLINFACSSCWTATTMHHHHVLGNRHNLGFYICMYVFINYTFNLESAQCSLEKTWIDGNSIVYIYLVHKSWWLFDVCSLFRRRWKIRRKLGQRKRRQTKHIGKRRRRKSQYRDVQSPPSNPHSAVL